MSKNRENHYWSTIITRMKLLLTVIVVSWWSASAHILCKESIKCGKKLEILCFLIQQVLLSYSCSYEFTISHGFDYEKHETKWYVLLKYRFNWIYLLKAPFSSIVSNHNINTFKYCKNYLFQGYLDRENSRLFLLVTHVDDVGAAPLGLFICTTECHTVIKHGLELICRLAGESRFYGRLSPSVVMTDDSASEKKAISELWPDATQLLCVFHVCQAYMRWLQAQQHAIPSNDRDEQYSLFEKMVYAKDENEFNKRWVHFLTTSIQITVLTIHVYTV